MYIKVQFTGYAEQDEQDMKRFEGLSAEEVLDQLKEMEQGFIREMENDGVTVIQTKIELMGEKPQ